MTVQITRRRVLVATVLVLTAGCSLLQPAADQAGRALKRICAEISEPVRVDAERRVNEAAAPHSVTITCAPAPE